MSKIETGTDGTVRLSQEYPVRENPQLTDAIMVGDVESGTVSSTTAGNIKTLYTGSIAENNDGFVTGGDVAAALALKPDGDDMTVALDKKVDKVQGMGLSHEDYTAPEKDDMATLSMFYKPVNDALDGINGEPGRGGVPGKLAKLAETKKQFKQEINNKGVFLDDSTAFAQYPAKISQIETGRPPVEDWIPNASWPDIKKILREDTSVYEHKEIILLLGNEPDTIIFDSYSPETIKYLRFSDGSEETFTEENPATSLYTHTWDVSADITDSNDRPIRWMLIGADEAINVGYRCAMDILMLYSTSRTGFYSSTNFYNIYSIETEVALAQKQTGLQYTYNLRRFVDKNVKEKGFLQVDVQYGVNGGGFNVAPNLETPQNIIFSGDFGGSLYTSIVCQLQNVNLTLHGTISAAHFSVYSHNDNILNSLVFTEASTIYYDSNYGDKICMPPAYVVDLSRIPLDKFWKNGPESSVISLNGTLSYALTYSLSLPKGFKWSLDISSFRFLTSGSLVNIMESLEDRKEKSALKLKMGAINLNKLTDEQKAIVTDKNWELA